MENRKGYAGLVGVGILALFIAFEISNCSFESPKIPTWELPINIPIIDKKYTMEELATDYEEIFIGENGQLGIRFEGDFDTTFIKNRLRISDVTETIKLDLGTFEVPALGARADVFRFSQLWHDAAAHNGQTVSVPAFSFSDIEGSPIGTIDFYSTLLKRGYARIVVRNNLHVPLHDLVLTYKDKITNSQITQFTIENIAPMDSAVKELNFGGKTIPQTTVWVISGTSPGSEGATVSVNQAQTVELYIQFMDVLIQNITARIPSLDLTQEQMLFFGDEITLHEARSDSGKLVIKIENSTPLGTQFDLVLQQIVNNGNGAPLHMNVRLSPYQKTEQIFDLSNHTLRMDVKNDGAGSETPLDIVGGTEPSQDNYVTLADEHYISISVSLQDIVLTYIRGIVEKQEIVPDKVQKEIDLPDYVENPGTFNLKSGRFELIFVNSINVPVEFDGKVIGFNRNGRSESILINHPLKRGTNTLPESTVVVLDENDNLIDFLNLPPILIEAVGRLWVGDGVTMGEVSADDFIYGSFRFETAAAAQWNTTLINADTTEIRILPEKWDAGNKTNSVTTLDGEITKNLQSAKLLVQMENHIPVGADIRFLMHTDSTALFTNPKVILGPLHLKAPSTDDNGRVSGALVYEQALILSSKDSEIFKNTGDVEKPIFIATEITLNGTNGKTVQVFSDDYLVVKAMATIMTRVGQ